jgi:hypothetical protein
MDALKKKHNRETPVGALISPSLPSSPSSKTDSKVREELKGLKCVFLMAHVLILS